MMANSKMTVLPEPVGAHNIIALSVYNTCSKLKFMELDAINLRGDLIRKWSIRMISDNNEFSDGLKF